MGIALLIFIWLFIGGIEWYYVYPDTNKFPHPVFLLLWPFLSIVAIIKLIFEDDGIKKNRGE